MAVPVPIVILEAEARFHRERLGLYRTHGYASSPTSEMRMRQLERACSLAEARLREALSERSNGR